jgi:hypothetical protein
MPWQDKPLRTSLLKNLIEDDTIEERFVIKSIKKGKGRTTTGVDDAPGRKIPA